MEELTMNILAIGISVKIKIPRDFGHFSIETIERETKTLWVTDKGTRIDKANNMIKTTYRKVTLATNNDYEELERRKLFFKLEKYNFSKLDLETLRQINALISKA